MVKHNQDGAVNGTLLSLVFAVFLLAACVGFGLWAFSGMQDYKNHSDQKVAAAVKTAKQQESDLKDKQFQEEAKKPLTLYQAPPTAANIAIQYPKTWSAYADDSGLGTYPFSGYFAPGVVPSALNSNSVFALRVQLLNQTYSTVLQQLNGQVQSGKVSLGAYALPKVPSIVGVRATGQIPSIVPSGKNATMIVLPLRQQTLEIWTDGSQWLDDFNNNILPNFSFTP